MMYKQNPELLEKIRQQFKTAPYPRIELEKSPQDNFEALYVHNLVTPYYLRNQKVISTEGKVILDAGCGTGYKSLVLALANPGAHIVGIDLSEEAIDLARKRLEYHNIANAEFHVLPLEEISSLNLEFDYINCDEVLYLFEDITVGLQAFKSVLKPEGIIRTNLHSQLQRNIYFQAQEMFKMMGLMDQNPEEMEIQIVIEIMKSLKDDTYLKSRTWKQQMETYEEGILMNYLFQGDKGYTICDIFSALKKSNLSLLRMVNWRHWEVEDLFKEPDDLPAFLAMSLSEISVEDRLHLFELLHPIHRLLDFWCGNDNQTPSYIPTENWTTEDWRDATVHLHPQLKTPQVKEDLCQSIINHKPFEISRYIFLPTVAPLILESTRAACLLPLWEGSQPMMSLIERWQEIHPLDPITLESITPEKAFEEVKALLSRLEPFLYVLLERSA
jgi:2-polyprenyl-3-methyl-5-hydroxy-6-metoxy-1,4-benzoquinol methylase